MPTSSNRTDFSVHCCHGKHMVASLKTLLLDFIYTILNNNGGILSGASKSLHVNGLAGFM
jgi:hypothetical protein